jgi:uncharacterized phiE125 gp8 family phage protein
MTNTRLELITPSTVEPVELDEAKNFCKVTCEDDDLLIASFITAARQYVETYTRRSLLQQTWKLYLDFFPCNRIIHLPKSPLVSVTSVTYNDEDSVNQTFDATNYTVDVNDTRPARIILKENTLWPYTDRNGNAVQVTFLAGYQSNTDVVPPETLRVAMFQLIRNWYENRDVMTPMKMTEVPQTLNVLLNSERMPEDNV